MRVVIDGQGASRGLALGRALVRQPHALDTSEQRIEADQLETELDRLDRAMTEARDELHQLRDRLHGAIAQEIGDFLDLHALILDDPELRLGIESLVRDGRFSAEYALRLQHDRLAAVFDAMDDPYFRSRREDLDHVIGRVQTALHRQQITLPGEASGEILVVHSVAPAELAQLQSRGVVAVIADTGSALSHSAILARSLHMPLVFSGGEGLRRIADGDVVMIDGAGLTLDDEPNPALGLRGIRLSLSHPALFHSQLRAILRASEYGPVRILLPMVSRREELIAARAALRMARQSLIADGASEVAEPTLGAMIEVPAAALTLPQLRDQLDFVAVGTNDLVQYLLAADRNHPSLGDLYSPLHPALIQLLHGILHCGRQSRMEVTVCGEIAGDATLTPLLLALGLTAFSLHPATLLEVREKLSRCDRAALRRRLRSLLAARDQAGIERWLSRCV